MDHREAFAALWRGVPVQPVSATRKRIASRPVLFQQPVHQRHYADGPLERHAERRVKRTGQSLKRNADTPERDYFRTAGMAVEREAIVNCLANCAAYPADPVCRVHLLV